MFMCWSSGRDIYLRIPFVTKFLTILLFSMNESSRHILPHSNFAISCIQESIQYVYHAADAWIDSVTYKQRCTRGTTYPAYMCLYDLICYPLSHRPLLTLRSKFPCRPCSFPSLRIGQNQFQGQSLHDTPNKSHLQVAHSR